MDNFYGILVNLLHTFVEQINIMAAIKKETDLVRVDLSIKNKVAKKVAGTKVKIGQFYDEAAIEKLKSAKK